jgi:hypothetical protein
MNKFLLYCFFATFILGLIAFGYLFYIVIGYYTFLPTTVFIFASILGIGVFEREIKERVSKESQS